MAEPRWRSGLIAVAVAAIAALAVVLCAVGIFRRPQVTAHRADFDIAGDALMVSTIDTNTVVDGNLPFVATSVSEAGFTEDDAQRSACILPCSIVELAVAADAGTVDAVGSLIQSAQVSSDHPECLRFNILIPHDDMKKVSSMLWRTLVFHRLVDMNSDSSVEVDNFRYNSSGNASALNALGLAGAMRLRLGGGADLRVVAFDTAVMDKNIKVVGAASSSTPVCLGLEGCDVARAQRLRKPTNFARFFLATFLPDLTKVIWVDCDVLIKQDLQALWRMALPSHGKDAVPPQVFLGAFEEVSPLGRFYFGGGDVVGPLWEKRRGRPLNLSAASFNDGVIVIDLDKWRRYRVSEDVQWWMQQHKIADPALWKFGTQPIMLLLGTGGRWQRLPSDFYLGDLGFLQTGQEDQERVDRAMFLHFNGEHKPWMPASVYDNNSKSISSYNRHLLRPYMPIESPSDWLAAPGARCVPYATKLVPCEVGPLVPGVTVPSMHWWSPKDFFENPHKPVPLVGRLVEGFFSATPLSTPARGVLEQALFENTSIGAKFEVLFLRPQKIVGVYLQAASPQHSVRGARLQYQRRHFFRRSPNNSKWRNACGEARPATCSPAKGPSSTAGGSTACWQISSCSGIRAARRWRVAGFHVEAAEQLVSSMWLQVVPPDDHFRHAAKQLLLSTALAAAV